MATMVEFVDNKKSQELKKTFNHCIRLGQRFTEDNIIRIAKLHDVDPNLMRLWKLVRSIKLDALKRCEHDGWWKSFDDMDEVDGEGYVMWNRWGIYKLVDRDEFSRLNFLNVRCLGQLNYVSHMMLYVTLMDYNKYIVKKPL